MKMMKDYSDCMMSNTERMMMMLQRFCKMMRNVDKAKSSDDGQFARSVEWRKSYPLDARAQIAYMKRIDLDGRFPSPCRSARTVNSLKYRYSPRP